jgi:hypothetical protein
MLHDFYHALSIYKTLRHPDLPTLKCGKPLSTQNLMAKYRWPNSKRSGVYVVFNTNEKILHLGHSSVISKSLKEKFGDDVDKERKPAWKRRSPAHVVIVTVHKHPNIEAACLESFLRTRHPSLFNRVASSIRSSYEASANQSGAMDAK